MEYYAKLTADQEEPDFVKGCDLEELFCIDCDQPATHSIQGAPGLDWALCEGHYDECIAQSIDGQRQQRDDCCEHYSR